MCVCVFVRLRTCVFVVVVVRFFSQIILVSDETKEIQRNLYFYKKNVRESVREMCEMSIIKNDSPGSLFFKLMPS